MLSSCLQWRHSDAELTKIFAERALPLTIHTLQLDGVEAGYKQPLRYIEVKSDVKGKGSVYPKANILFIHGAPSSLRGWMGFMTDTALARSANLYAVDRPGYGYSGFGHSDTSILHQAELMLRVLERHPGPWVVFGSSYGGPIAAVLAALAPERVSAVMLTSPALAPGQERIYGISYYIRYPALGWFFPTIFRMANEEKLSHKSQLQRIAPYYAKITQPVTYMYGGQDELIYTTTVRYAQEKFIATKIRRICLQDRPHFFTFSEQGLITRELTRLLNKTTPPATELERSSRVEASDSARIGRRIPSQPMPIPRPKGKTGILRARSN
jgi:pimeloyl-ACP methyl ester carboxylesterase